MNIFTARRRAILGLTGFLVSAYLMSLWYKAGHGEASDGPVEPTNVTIDGRIQDTVVKLQSESVEQGLARLADIEMHYWPGYDGGLRANFLPFQPDEGVDHVLRIFSNRRFSKVLAELARLDKAKRQSLLRDTIESSLATYTKLYEAYLVDYRPGYLSDVVPSTSPVLVIGGNNGRPTVNGQRLHLLACLMLCAVLGEGNSEEVLEVSRIARDQYRSLCQDDVAHNVFRYFTAAEVSLYNRPVLMTAMLGCCDQETRELMEQNLKVKFDSHGISAFDAKATRFDLHGRMGAVPIESPQHKIQFVSHADDKDFEWCWETLSAAGATKQ